MNQNLKKPISIHKTVGYVTMTPSLQKVNDQTTLYSPSQVLLGHILPHPWPAFP